MYIITRDSRNFFLSEMKIGNFSVVNIKKHFLYCFNITYFTEITHFQFIEMR